MPKIDLTDRVAIVTGAGNGLGRSYAIDLASKGAKVVVNDLGPSVQDKSRKAAEVVVEEITKAGGQAIANLDSNLDGHKIVQQALDKWGRVDILINNAGILRDKSFKSMGDKEWDDITAVHITGSYVCAKACWPVFRKQKFGRIINISSAAGIYGNFGQANYSAAKMSMIAFSKTLAIEGNKYNILANTIAPIAASQMLASVMPKEVMDNLKPEFVAPIITYLCSPQNAEITGQTFETGAGFLAALRRQRTRGVVFRADDTFTPSAVQARIDEILDFDESPEYPEKVTDANHLEFLERAKAAQPNKQGEKVRFDGKTVLITGAGAGLGAAYARMFGALGANVVVNDFNEKAALAVVDQVKKAGGKAAPAVGSVEDGDKIVQAALDAFGSLHVVINNAGILRDKSFASVTDKEWHDVVNIHLRGTYKVCKAAWPIFQKQKYGRIVNTTSAVGIYGNFGQANYSTAKGGILGFTQTLAIEGQKNNILANTIAPNAGTAMTATIWPKEMVDAFKPEFVAPVVGYLASEANTEHTKLLWEISGGWVAATRWQRSGGHAFPADRVLTADKVSKHIPKVLDFDDGRSGFPNTNQEAIMEIMSNIGSSGGDDDDDDDEAGGDDFSDPEDPDIVKQAKKNVAQGEYTFQERDVALYNLSLGVKASDLKYTFEQHEEFQPLPSFAVVPSFSTSTELDLNFLPNFSPMMLLHGEQSFKVLAAPPTSGKLTSTSRIAEVLDKGKAAAVRTVTTTKDESGKPIYELQSVVFIRGSGGFGGKKTGKDWGFATAANKPPSRPADKVVVEKTGEDQAALYRLNGDYNPLHIDPDFAAVGGFKKPIIHGLCSYGIACKHVTQAFGTIDAAKARFSATVIPGETLETHMWKEGNTIIFEVKNKDNGSTVLSAAAATLAKKA